MQIDVETRKEERDRKRVTNVRGGGKNIFGLSKMFEFQETSETSTQMPFPKRMRPGELEASVNIGAVV